VLIIGECEELWPRFLRDWENDRHQPEYRQITPPDLTRAPAPRWDSIAADFATHYRRGSVQTTRGCPFDCEFCDVIYIYGRTQRHKDVESVVAEMRKQHDLGARTIFVADDAFEADRQYGRRLLEALIPVNNSFDIPLAFEVQCGLNVASHEPLLRLLADANFELLWMGVESPSPESLKSINKLQNVRRDLVSDLRRIGSYGIGVAAYTIVGLDEDDDEIFDRHIRLWEDARILIPIVNILTAVPHTKLWLRLAREGRLLTRPGAREGVVDLTSNIIPKRMSRRQLIEGYRHLLAKAANWEFFAGRVMAWVGSVTRLPEVSDRHVTEALVEQRRAALLGGREARTCFEDIVAHTRQRQPALLGRVLSYVETHDGRSWYLEQYHLPQLREFLRSRAVDQRESRVKWRIPVPEGFRTAFRRQILPRVYAHVRANLAEERLLAEALTEVFVGYLIRFAHEYGTFPESHTRYLDEIAGRVCARLNGVSPEGFVPRQPASAPASVAELNTLADRLLKSIAEDLIKQDPSLHAPERDPLHLG
jgi:radical SAM superfamily enzyme YgiQ (UPF0313 family)